MPTVIQLRFPGRRYHATPWGHHVNEGQVEWPPSPWRLLRALLATGFTKLHWPPETPPPAARRLVERLAALAPAYALPAVSTAHTRHYVEADQKKPLIFDTWAQVDDQVLEVQWDLDLREDERAVLVELAEHLGYLGRAESWTLASVVDAPTRAANCLPDRDGPPGPGFDALRVLGAAAPETYLDWRAARVAAIESRLAPEAGRKPSAAVRKKLAAALAPYPADLVAALCADTSTLKAQGWSAAPGSRELLYWRKGGGLSVRVSPKAHPARVPTVPFALLALSTASRGKGALPPLERAFPQGRLLHKALTAAVRGAGGEPRLSILLLGKAGSERALLDHQHAHLLPLDLDGDQRLDHVLVYAPMGLDAAAQQVLRATSRTWMKGGAGELTVALAGLGEAETLCRLPDPAGQALAAALGPPQGATHWVSDTPYVAPRMLKRRGRDSIEGQVQLECARRGLPEPSEVQLLAVSDEGVRRLRHFVLHDATHEPPWRARHALVLRFPLPIQGPLCLGYGAHYGLGRFRVLS